ncbi:Trm112 family protein [Streptomyces gobitricini]|uniref:Trm112 family protein n=1 Tax=Streptomyces gobitricini TaxID=68211 RepID=A0ABP5ZN10_9ACTN
MKPDDPLLKILVCPLDKGPLSLLPTGDALYNPRLRRLYPVTDGIPQLLPSSGTQVTDAEHERLLAPGTTDARPEGPARLREPRADGGRPPGRPRPAP